MANTTFNIAGIVTDKNGSEIPGANIYFISAPVAMPDISILTDNKGRFVLSVPVEGKYVLGVNADGYESTEIKSEVVKNKVINLNIRL